jgi:hypothetical protein
MIRTLINNWWLLALRSLLAALFSVSHALYAAPYDLFKQLPKHVRLMKPVVAILGKCGMVRDFLIKAQPCEPAPRQMHPQLLDELASAGHTYKYPIGRIRNNTSGSIDGPPISL